MFGLTKPLVSVVDLFGLWSFNCSWSWPAHINLLWLLATLRNRFQLSLASPSSCLSDLESNCAQLWLVDGLVGRPFVGLIGLDLDWLMLLVPFSQSFSWLVKDKIIFLNNNILISDLYQNHMRTLRDFLDNPLDFFLLWSLPAMSMLQGSSTGVTAITPL